MGRFTHLMLHTTATPPGREVSRADIEQWHLVERGWSRVGYSALFELDGTMDILIPFDSDDVIESWELSNGAKGWNGCTRHWASAGAAAHDSRTSQQMAAMEAAIKMHVSLWPDVKIIGHNQVNRFKTCPGYSVPDWLETIGIPERNIDRKVYYNKAYN